ncbi:hypothetical protein AB6A68_08960 [Ferrimicrobium acidiphilum]|uniref:Uncharacterized protein n=1 Tax=Ferrimicrobium acidiphilum TaxID=121039 RepID=A0ABV3Y330_9ACTN
MGTARQHRGRWLITLGTIPEAELRAAADRRNLSDVLAETIEAEWCVAV